MSKAPLDWYRRLLDFVGLRYREIGRERALKILMPSICQGEYPILDYLYHLMSQAQSQQLPKNENYFICRVNTPSFSYYNLFAHLIRPSNYFSYTTSFSCYSCQFLNLIFDHFKQTRQLFIIVLLGRSGTLS